MEHPGKTFITEVTISSPEGIRLVFGRSGVTQINADGSTTKLEGRGAVGDVNYVVFRMFYSQEGEY